MEKTSKNKMGEAYAFFYYEGKQEEIQKDLPKIREVCKSPLEMKLSLSKIDNFDSKGDSALSKKRYYAKDADRNYVLKAILPNESNIKTAAYLGQIGTGLLYSLYDGNKNNFCLDILYKKGEKYVFKRN